MTRSDTDDPPVPGKRQRIAKLMARAGLCSRRDAEAWIVDGRVSVNGEVLTSPALDVSPDDAILVDGAPLPAPEKTRLFLFHKPRGLVTSDHDPEGRATVADYLREHWPEGPRVVTVGRLDINTEGLLLLTNDGGLARVLELPQTGWVRRYRVRAKGAADPAALDALAAGVTIDGIDYAGIEAKLDRVQGANSWLTMGLREGKNREVKRVLEHIGLEVNRLIRLSFGPFQLLDLPDGAVEEVRTRVLRDQLGATLAAQAGVDFGETAPIVAPPEKPSRGRPEAPARIERGGGRGVTPGRKRRPEARHDASRGDRPRGNPGRERPNHRGDVRAAPETPPIRERPASGPRKHVSTLRAEKADAARDGSRTRIERSDTRDRKDRTVTVERRVPSRPPVAEAPARRGRPPGAETQARRGRDAPARGQAEDRRPRSGERQRPDERPPGDRAGRGRPVEGPRGARREPASGRPPARFGDKPRDDRAGRRRDAEPASRGRASPSAAGKRERVARSGPRRDDAPNARPGRPARPRSAPHDDSPAPRPGRSTTGKPPGAPRKPGGKPSGGKPSGGKPPSGRPSRGRPPSGGAPRGPRGPSKPKR